MTLIERCDHNHFSAQLAERVLTTTALVPTASGEVAITHNNPPDTTPGTIDRARETYVELNRFLTEAPVIQDDATARRGSGLVEITRISLKAMDDERKQRVSPLNDQVAAINAIYRQPRETLERLQKAVRERLTAYALAVEEAREAEAKRLRDIAEAAEAAARAAEAAEQEAIADAEVGVETDIGAAIEQADEAFAGYQATSRAAARAERNIPLRFGSVTGGRAQTMRTTEVLSVADVGLAIKAMGLTPKITEALLSSARDYRKAHGELPAGIASTSQRSM